MAALTTQYFWHCKTAEHWQTSVFGSKGDRYIVTWGDYAHKNRHTVQHDYSCTCKAYSMRPGYCKHIKDVIAQKLHCNWNQFISGGEPIYYIPRTGAFLPRSCCPNCKGDINSMGYAV